RTGRAAPRLLHDTRRLARPRRNVSPPRRHAELRATRCVTHGIGRTTEAPRAPSSREENRVVLCVFAAFHSPRCSAFSHIHSKHSPPGLFVRADGWCMGDNALIETRPGFFEAATDCREDNRRWIEPAFLRLRSARSGT